MRLVEPRPHRPLPIRITPLIDVVFILLVFFMLTSHLLPTDVLELDNTSRRGGTQTGEPNPELVLQSGGELRWNDRNWEVQALIGELRQRGHDTVDLRTEGDASLGDFTRQFSTLEAAGIETSWRRPGRTGDGE